MSEAGLVPKTGLVPKVGLMPEVDSTLKAGPISKTSLAPKAYREGFCDFYGRKFLVSPEVLIPRPETEMVVDTVLSLAGRSILPGVKAPKARIETSGLTILDVGTGSGCIAETLKLEIPEARVAAVDVSSEALEVARKNAVRLGADVEFLQSDLLAGVELGGRFGDFSGFGGEAGGGFDGDLVVTANLPYVDRGWEWVNREALALEPELALYARDGGLAIYKRFFAELSKKFVQNCGKPSKFSVQNRLEPCPDGVASLGRTGISSRSSLASLFHGKLWVVTEADPCQHEKLKKYAETLEFRHIETRGFALLFCAV